MHSSKHGLELEKRQRPARACLYLGQVLWTTERAQRRGLGFPVGRGAARRAPPGAARPTPQRRCAALRWPPRARRPCAVVLEPAAYATGLARDLRATVSGRAPDVDGGELNLMRRAGRASLVGGDGEAEIEEVSDLPRMF